MNAVAMIARCADHQPDDARYPTSRQLDPTRSNEVATASSGEYVPEEREED